MITFVTQTALTRRLGICNATLRRRVAAGLISPDAILIEGSRLEPTALFNLARMSAIRAAVLPKPRLKTIATQ